MLAEKPEVSAFLEAMTVRFLEFLSVNEHWSNDTTITTCALAEPSRV